MSSVRKNPSFKTAIDYLRSRLASKAWGENDKLPDVATLALTARVSKAAMCAAVADLKKEGLLEVGHSGIYLPRSERTLMSQDMERAARTKSARIARALRIDIIKGKYTGALPTLTVLATHHGVAPCTMHKALQSLITENIVRVKGTRYILPIHEKTTPSAHIVLISSGTHADILTQNEFHRSFCISMELACHQHRFSLRECAFVRDAHSGDALPPDIPDDAFGYVVFVNTIPHTKLPALLRKITARNRPVALIDETGTFVLPDEMRSYQNIRVFLQAARNAGCAMGNFLLQHGHQNAAYLTSSLTQSLDWSKKRFTGLLYAFTEAGLSHGLQRIVGEIPMDDGRGTHISTLIDRGGKEMRRRINERLGNLLDGFEGLLTSTHGLGDRIIARHGKLETVIADVDSLIAFEYHFDLFRPLLQTLLSNKKITAWVAQNDFLGRVAMTFLQSHERLQTDTISVVAFDNTIDAHVRGISSYDFDFVGMAQLALAFIINPRDELFADKMVIEHEGYIVERKSSRMQK